MADTTNSMGSRFTQETNLWAGLQREFLDCINWGMKTPLKCRQHYSRDWGADSKEEASGCQRSPLSASCLGAMRPAAQ